MIAGADISTLEETEQLGGVFYYHGIKRELIDILTECGISSARLRLWNDPFGENGEPYLGGTNDIKSIERLSRRAKDAGWDILLDFHYSDFWCDPGRQMIPKAWQGMDVKTMCSALYDFTARTLERLGSEGLAPASVQVGNEITNGMLWPLARLSEDSPRNGYENLSAFLDAGCRAVRASSDAEIMLHLERSGNGPLWHEWLDAVTGAGVDFDSIGASYYPYWHGPMPEMKKNLSECGKYYGKKICITETAYPFTTEHFDPTGETKDLCIADGAHNYDGSPVEYPLSIAGQQLFTQELLKTAEDIGCTGVYWWEPGWLPVKGSSWASNAALSYCHEEGVGTGNEWANQCLFDYSGNSLPALDAIRDYFVK